MVVEKNKQNWNDYADKLVKAESFGTTSPAGFG